MQQDTYYRQESPVLHKIAHLHPAQALVSMQDDRGRFTPTTLRDDRHAVGLSHYTHSESSKMSSRRVAAHCRSTAGAG
jgi:hypothetical protein